MIHLIVAISLLFSQGTYLVESVPYLNLQENTSNISAPIRINPENIGVKLTGDKYLALDVNSGRVLLERNSNQKQPIASITKLMTALVILDQDPDWQMPVEMKKTDETYGAQPHLYRGEQMTFIDLWKSALISSDNNAIMAMVRSLGFSRPEFVELMNKKAYSLRLFNSTFDDPTGLSEYNQSTATDIAKLVYEAIGHNEIRESVIQGKYTFQISNNKKRRNIYNTDILIDSFLNSSRYGYELIGGKTGYLPEAGYCLAVEISKSDNPVIFVVLNSNTIYNRFQDTKSMADWVFTNYKWE